jgi:hypothetical protein
LIEANEEEMEQMYEEYKLMKLQSEIVEQGPETVGG